MPPLVSAAPLSVLVRLGMTAVDWVVNHGNCVISPRSTSSKTLASSLHEGSNVSVPETQPHVLTMDKNSVYRKSSLNVPQV